MIIIPQALSYLVLGLGLSTLFLLIPHKAGQESPARRAGFYLALLFSWTAVVLILGSSKALLVAIGIFVVVFALMQWLFKAWTFAAYTFYSFFIASGLTYGAYLVDHLSTLTLFWDRLLFVWGVLVFTIAFLFALLELFTLLNISARRTKRLLPRITEAARTFNPMVSIHVPIYSEPAEVVIGTLNALKELDYPRYEVIVIDNNTTDESLWRPVEARCKELGSMFRFYHVENLRGAKAGALNYVISRTSPEAEIVAVVDADYQVKPNFLKDLVPYFFDPHIALVQTPQDYRDYDKKSYLANCLDEYRVFFSIVTPSMFEYNAASFLGTMGLIRKSVLTNIKRWSEWCVTEDTELGVRIHQNKLKTIFVDRTYGRGLMPYEFQDYKKQRRRWAFGNVQIILRNFFALLPLPGLDGRLSIQQKISYLAQLLVWSNALFLTTLFVIGLALATLFGSIPGLSTLFLGFILLGMFLLTKSMTFLWGFKRKDGLRFDRAFKALFSHFSVNWPMATAWLACLIVPRADFWRTKKYPHELKMNEKIRAVGWETFFFCLTTSLAVGLFVLGYVAAGVLLALLCMFVYTPALIAVVHYSYYADSSVSAYLETDSATSLRGERAGS